MALPADPNQSFFREVDEEVRRERIGGFGRRYGLWLLAAAIALALGIGGYLFWKNSRDTAAEAEGETLDAVITEIGAGNDKAAGPKLAALEKSKSAGYRAAALLTRADLLLAEGKDKEAAAAFGRISADEALPKPYRNLAIVRRTAAEFDTIAPALVIDRLRPLVVRGGAFHGSAGEMTGAAYLKQNRPDRAGPIFAAVARDESVPESIRSRVVQMAGSLGLDAVPEGASLEGRARGATRK